MSTIEQSRTSAQERSHSADAIAPESFLLALRNARQVTLLEGLPHPEVDSHLFLTERVKENSHLELGEAVYDDALPLGSAESEAITQVLLRAESIETYRGSKRCGGFHADFVVTWHTAECNARALICFGCGEIRIDAGGVAETYDLNETAYADLKSILREKQNHRPMGESDAWRHADHFWSRLDAEDDGQPSRENASSKAVPAGGN